MVIFIRNAALVSGMIALAACGGSDVESEGAIPGGSSEEEVGAQADQASERPNNMIAKLDFSQTGAAEVRHEYEVEDLSLTGGCAQGEGVSFGFMDNANARSPSGFYVAFDGRFPIEAGQTGTFPVEEIRWMNGNVPHPELEGINVPLQYEGPGELTITEHKGGGMNGRMKGTFSGDLVERQSGDEASVTVDFDVFLGCTNLNMMDM
ncbi:hypothetical protein ACI5KX_04365 [Erythrobacter sp. GH1-10]|uniref:hypothetical protein n=1 Tax=Erythrobacter sp. GH1-10 TaxID=3349334 RepID=UPI003877ADF0